MFIATRTRANTCTALVQNCVTLPRTGSAISFIAPSVLSSLGVNTLPREGAEAFSNSSFPLSSSLSQESNITVSLSSNASEVLEGDVIQLSCSAQSTTGPLSVVWHWTDKEETGAAQEVASVDRDGTVWHSPAYRERSSYGEVRVEKVRADAFSLSLYSALPGDEGEYGCTVTEWSQTDTQPEPDWEKIGEMSATKTVAVKTVGKSFQANLTTVLCMCHLKVSKACEHGPASEERGIWFVIR